MFTLNIKSPREPQKSLEFVNEEIAKIVAYTMSTDYNYFGVQFTVVDGNGKLIQKIDDKGKVS